LRAGVDQERWRHPWAANLLFSRPVVAPGALRAVDVIYTALIDAEVSEPDTPRLERLIGTFALGFAASNPSMALRRRRRTGRRGTLRLLS
jgi:hypothetical protein